MYFSKIYFDTTKLILTSKRKVRRACQFVSKKHFWIRSFKASINKAEGPQIYSTQHARGKMLLKVLVSLVVLNILEARSTFCENKLSVVKLKVALCDAHVPQLMLHCTSKFQSQSQFVNFPNCNIS